LTPSDVGAGAAAPSMSKLGAVLHDRAGAKTSSGREPGRSSKFGPACMERK